MENAIWTAELLVDLSPGERFAPFTAIEHTFSSLEEAQEWLGIVKIRGASGEG